MDRIREAFEKDFSLPLPDAMLPAHQDVTVDESGYFASSSPAHERKFMIQGHIQDFVDSAPDGYYALGYWGHGINSYAFYYVRVAGPIRVFFRLPYGGVYEDADEQAALIREFLPRYLAFEDRLKQGGLVSLVAVESMGSSSYTVVMNSGKRLELSPREGSDESPFHHPEVFDRCLEELGA